MTGSEQLDFFEKKKISPRPEPPKEGVLTEPENVTGAGPKRNKNLFDRKLKRILDRLRKKLGENPKNPQEELIEDEA